MLFAYRGSVTIKRNNATWGMQNSMRLDQLTYNHTHDDHRGRLSFKDRLLTAHSLVATACSQSNPRDVCDVIWCQVSIHATPQTLRNCSVSSPSTISSHLASISSELSQSARRIRRWTIPFSPESKPQPRASAWRQSSTATRAMSSPSASSQPTRSLSQHCSDLSPIRSTTRIRIFQLHFVRVICHSSAEMTSSS